MLTLTSADLAAAAVTLKLAALSTLILLVIGAPLAWWLARTRWRGRFLVDAVIALPLVLPPTVLGFYLLIAMAPDSPVGRLYAALFPDRTLPFSFTGVVVASVFYSLPFMVHPLMQAFEQVGRAPLELAATLGAPRWARWWHVLFPLARRGFWVAITLTFAHTVGEFGVILMVGGNIPGVTQVASIAVYDEVESMNYPAAHALSAVLLVFSFATLWLVYWLNRRQVAHG